MSDAVADRLFDRLDDLENKYASMPMTTDPYKLACLREEIEALRIEVRKAVRRNG